MVWVFWAAALAAFPASANLCQGIVTASNASFAACTFVDGTLVLNGAISALALPPLPVASVGNLIVQNTDLIDLQLLSNLKTVNISITIFNNSFLQTLSGLEQLIGIVNLTIDSNPSLVSIASLAQIATAVNVSILSNPALSTLQGLQGLRIVSGDLMIFNNSNLTSLDGLPNLQEAHSIRLDENAAITSVSELQALTTVHDTFEILCGSSSITVTLPLLARAGNIVVACDASGNIRLSMPKLEVANGLTVGPGNSATPSFAGIFPSLTQLGSLSLIALQGLISASGFERVLVSNLAFTLLPHMQMLGNFTAVSNLTSVSLTDLPSLKSFTGLEEVSRIEDFLAGELGLTSLKGLENLKVVTSFRLSMNYNSLDNLNLLSLGTAPGTGGVISAPLVSVEPLKSVLIGSFVVSPGFCCPPVGIFASGSPLWSVVNSGCVMCMEFTGAPSPTTVAPGGIVTVPARAYLNTSYALFFCPSNGVPVGQICTVRLDQILCEVPNIPLGKATLSFLPNCPGSNYTGRLASFWEPAVLPSLTVVDWKTWTNITNTSVSDAWLESGETLAGDLVAAKLVRSDDLPQAPENTSKWEGYVIVGVIGAELFVLAILVIMRRTDWLIPMDWMGYTHRLDTAVGSNGGAPLMLRKTGVGGLASSFVFVGTIVLTTSYLIEVTQFNVRILSSLQPGMLATSFPASDYDIYVTVSDYFGQCSGLKAQTTGVVEGQETGKVQDGAEPRSCVLKWQCPNCVLDIQATVGLEGDANSFGGRVQWNVSTKSPFNKEFAIAGVLRPKPGHYFRASPISTIDIGFLLGQSRPSPAPTSWKQGVFLSRPLVSPGTVVVGGTAGGIDGFGFLLSLTRSPDTLVVSEYQKRSAQQAFARSVAIMTGVHAAARLFLQVSWYMVDKLKLRNLYH